MNITHASKNFGVPKISVTKKIRWFLISVYVCKFFTEIKNHRTFFAVNV